MTRPGRMQGLRRTGQFAALVLADPKRTFGAVRSLPDFAGARVPLRPAPHPQIGSSPNRSVQ